MTAFRSLTVCIVTLTALFPLDAAAQSPTDRQLFFEAGYLREPTDRNWSIRIAGLVPSMPGCYLIVHNADGRLLVKRHLPHGNYPAAAPLMIQVPADGITGDYRLIIVGYQDDTLQRQLPLTDLPFEVYGRTYFAARAGSSALLFRVPDGVEAQKVNSYSGGLRIMEGDTVVTDTRKDGKPEGRDFTSTFTPKPGATYQLVPYGCFYFRSETGLFLTFDMARWFAPDPRLEEVKWWQLTEK